MPASTSSKTRVGRLSASAPTVLMASITRASSPPEATRASRPSGSPGLAEKRISACSAPPGVSSGRGSRPTSKRAPSRRSPASSSLTWPPIRAAAASRRAVSSAAAASRTRLRPSASRPAAATAPAPSRDAALLARRGSRAPSPQLAELPLEELPVAGATLPEPLQIGRRLDCGAPGGVRRRDRGKGVAGAGEAVEEPGLGVGVEQRLVLLLAVDVDQEAAQLAELAGRRRAAVEAGRAPAAHLPPGDELRLPVEAHLLQQ